MEDKKCPRCGLWSPATAMRCDCGYDFDTKTLKSSFADAASQIQAEERAERNLPTIVVRGIVFVVVYLGLTLSMALVLGVKPGGLLIGVAFGVAAAVAAMIKIKVRSWF